MLTLQEATIATAVFIVASVVASAVAAVTAAVIVAVVICCCTCRRCYILFSYSDRHGGGCAFGSCRCHHYHYQHHCYYG